MTSGLFNAITTLFSRILTAGPLPYRKNSFHDGTQTATILENKAAVTRNTAFAAQKSYLTTHAKVSFSFPRTLANRFPDYQKPTIPSHWPANATVPSAIASLN